MQTPQANVFHDESSKLVETSYSIGDMVQVESRTWPGINKPGGVGRVTKVNIMNEEITIDVKYVLGGTEKLIDLIYVSKWNVLAVGRVVSSSSTATESGCRRGGLPKRGGRLLRNANCKTEENKEGKGGEGVLKTKKKKPSMQSKRCSPVSSSSKENNSMTNVTNMPLTNAKGDQMENVPPKRKKLKKTKSSLEECEKKLSESSLNDNPPKTTTKNKNKKPNSFVAPSTSTTSYYSQADAKKKDNAKGGKNDTISNETSNKDNKEKSKSKKKMEQQKSKERDVPKMAVVAEEQICSKTDLLVQENRTDIGSKQEFIGNNGRSSEQEEEKVRQFTSIVSSILGWEDEIKMCDFLQKFEARVRAIKHDEGISKGDSDNNSNKVGELSSEEVHKYLKTLEENNRIMLVDDMIYRI